PRIESAGEPVLALQPLDDGADLLRYRCSPCADGAGGAPHARPVADSTVTKGAARGPPPGGRWDADCRTSGCSSVERMRMGCLYAAKRGSTAAGSSKKAGRLAW